MLLYLLRGAFILLAASVTMLYVLPFQQEQEICFTHVLLMLGITLGITLAIIAIDAFTRHKKLSAMSGIFLGLIAGLVIAFALSFVVDLIVTIVRPGDEAFINLMQGVKVLIGLITCYLSMSLVMQTKDDFRFVIPYVEFAKKIRGNRPTILDTSVIIDGRILDIVQTQVIQGMLLVPKFILNELQLVADSPVKLKRSRGRRGLDILQKLQDSNVVDVTMEETDAEGSTVDQKLVSLAQQLRARVMTNDYNLNKVATLRGVDVININDLAKALRPVVLPGEMMNVKILKAGESAGQGVGYLDDGTMVVVENAQPLIGKEIDLVVTSMLQTSAGRMIFGKVDGTGDAHSPGESHAPLDIESGHSPDHSARITGRNPRRAH